MNFAEMGSAHFIFIPGVMLIGVVIGWILGSRAAADAYAAQLRKMQTKPAASTQPPPPKSPTP
jgi:hypothetical protein